MGEEGGRNVGRQNEARQAGRQASRKERMTIGKLEGGNDGI